eukprot:m.1438242 g.1438242  ORF g.1438242 m.1438242 type:complete len:2086 (+) comp25089_c0_seq3:340-6597(+)
MAQPAQANEQPAAATPPVPTKRKQPPSVKQKPAVVPKKSPMLSRKDRVPSRAGGLGGKPSVKARPAQNFDSGSRDAKSIDSERRLALAYEYLCHLEETRTWMEACLREEEQRRVEEECAASGGHHLSPEEKMLQRIGAIDNESTTDTTDLPPPPPATGDDTEADSDLPPPPPDDDGDTAEAPDVEDMLPPATELEESLRNGVYLVRLAHWFAPEAVSSRHMYDVDQKVYKERGLVFRHTDNVNQWIKAMNKKGMPKIFFPEVTDIYDKKNMPKAIYCIHALSRFLYSLGIGPLMEDLTGKAQFTEEEISAMDGALKEAGVQMPQFGKIGGMLAAEIGEDAAAMHAAILAINQCLEQEEPAEDLLKLLLALHAGLEDVTPDLRERYRTDLLVSRTEKSAQSVAQPDDAPSEESTTDIYDTNLTREEIQKTINVVNIAVAAEKKKAATDAALAAVAAAVEADDIEALKKALVDPLLGLTDVATDDAAKLARYLASVKAGIANGAEVTPALLQDIIDETNTAMSKEVLTAQAFAAVTEAVNADDAQALGTAIANPLLGLIEVHTNDDAKVARYLAALKVSITADTEVTSEFLQQVVNETNEAVQNEALLAEALAAVASAVAADDGSTLGAALASPRLALTDVRTEDEACVGRYLSALKTPLAEDSELTTAVVQRVIDDTNTAMQNEALAAEALAAINRTIASADADALMAALICEHAHVTDVDQTCALEYLVQLSNAKPSDDVVLSLDEVQAAVNEANVLVDEHRRAEAVLAEINTHLYGDEEATVTELLTANKDLLELPLLDPQGYARYYTKMCDVAKEKGKCNLVSVIDCIKTTNAELGSERIFAAALAALNAAARGTDPAATFASLGHEALGLTDLRTDVVSDFYAANGPDRYHDTLNAAIAAASEATDAVDDNTAVADARAGDEPTADGAADDAGATAVDPDTVAPGPLTRDAVQDAIHATNAAMEQERDVADALGAVNGALRGDDCEATLAALVAAPLALTDIDAAGAEQYHVTLKDALAHKVPAAAEADGEDEVVTSSPTAALTLPELQERINHTNFVAEENAKHAAAVFFINEVVQKSAPEKTLTALEEPYSRLTDVQSKCAVRYQDAIKQALLDKNDGQVSFPWKVVKSDDRSYYYNKNTKETQWIAPDNTEQVFLTKDEIQASVVQCNEDQAHQEFLEANQDKITTVQSQVRGFLTRKAYLERKNLIEAQTPAILKMQAICRMLRQKKRFRERLAFLNAQGDAAERIQAAWKGTKVRRNYKGLTKKGNPPVNTVRRFLHLLDQSEIDFAEELQVSSLKESVVMDIKNNQQLEQTINEMDIKIELLVKNRIQLQDVVKTSKQLKKQQKRGETVTGVDTSDAHGIKALDKRSRQRLLSFQHLFYLLQTHPQYLANLVFVEVPLPNWSQKKARTFLERIIETTYNYGSSSREKYLILRLFRAAMSKEVDEKITNVSEFKSGDPTVVRLFTNHYRGQGSDDYFPKVLSAPMRELLTTDDLDLVTDPVEIYKRHVNQIEGETGEKSDLPYEVQREEAMKHAFVRQTITSRVAMLLTWSAKFLSAVVQNVALLPFGLRFLCKCLQSELQQKFKDSANEDITAVLSHILFTKYISPVIISPEGRNVADDILKNQLMGDVQRKNLAAVARVMQFAVLGKSFDATPEMAELNAFLVSASARFKEFFESAVDVETAEEHFHIDEYSDVTMLSKPVIYITPREIHHTHELLLHNIDVTAPAKKDPLRMVIDDLGPVAEGEEALADTAQADGEMSLVLTNKFEVPEKDDNSIKALFVRTKRLVVDVIRFQQGKTLKAILETPTTEADEEQHMVHAMEVLAKEAELQKSSAKDGMASPSSKNARRISKEGTTVLTLDEIKRNILGNLPQLEAEGLCSQADGYQGILNAIAQDIRNQRIYRRQRKQELAKLRATVEELAKKKKHHAEQIEYYDQYVQSCMAQTTKKKGHKKGLFSKKYETDDEGRHAGSYKYTAKALMEKGVLIDIDRGDHKGISLKNIMIEIKSETEGEFSFRASYAGFSIDKETIAFQDLLQNKFNNITTMKICDGMATINVNLTVFLINKKFYNKVCSVT